jgi:hypothetical protein
VPESENNERFLEQQLAGLEEQWLRGYFPAVIEAFQLCAANTRALPDWLVPVVNGSLHVAFHEGGREGRGKKGGHFAQARRMAIEQRRWSWAKHWLNARECLPGWGYKATREGAFEFTSDLLRGTIAQGSPRAIEDSYERIEKSLKTAPAYSSN